MISKERLEELIEQGATIYEVKYNNINSVSLTNKIRFVSDKNKVIVFEPRPDEKYLHHKYFKNLFETKEEAEWHKEFGCIKRTERLELPTWEESKKCDTICNFDDVEFDYFVHNNTYGLYQDCYELLDLEATKENYTLACRKAKELFLGEIKND